MTSNIEAKFSSRDYFTLEFIPFVTSTQTEEPNTAANNHKGNKYIASEFTGKEASDFYKGVLEIPSTSKSECAKPNVTSKKHVKKISSSKTINYNSKNLHKYAQDGNLDAIKECLSNDIKLINQQDMYGWTPLMCATCEGYFEVSELLVKLGADLTVKNDQGMTALDIATTKEFENIIKLFKEGVQSAQQYSGEFTGNTEFYCSDCKLLCKESKIIHDKSIAHLFSTRKPNHTTFYHIPENNKGFQIMVKSGWNKNKGLGSKEEGQKFPIKTILKKDRSCIGRNKEVARVTHYNANDHSAVKRISDPSMKIVREKTLKKWQRIKLERKNRQKEIEYRRQFACDY